MLIVLYDSISARYRHLNSSAKCSNIFIDYPLRIQKWGLVEALVAICDLLLTIGQKKKLEVGKKRCLDEN
jgi:hypothetical protein